MIGVKSLLYFSIADCLPSRVKLKTLRKDGMKPKGLTFGVRDKIARLSAWGLAKFALSGAIKSGIASLHANSPAARLNSPWGIGEMNGLGTHKPISSALLSLPAQLRDPCRRETYQI
jgi:hypothetical protein